MKTTGHSTQPWLILPPTSGGYTVDTHSHACRWLLALLVIGCSFKQCYDEEELSYYLSIALNLVTLETKIVRDDLAAFIKIFFVVVVVLLQN